MLLAFAGCGGSERSPPQPSEPARLFLAGDGELTVVDVDVARAEVHELPVFAPGDPLYRIVRRGDKLVVFGFDTYVLDVDLRLPPRKLGDSWFFIPSAEPDRVWLSQLDRNSPETRRAIATVREVSVAGRVTFPAVRPPRDEGPLTAVGDALVFGTRQGGLELWNPSTGEFTRRFEDAYLGPTQGTLLAWCEDEGRVLHVIDVGSGDDRTIEPPQEFATFDCWSGAFSPDGKTLAVAALYEGAYDDDRTLALVDLGDGEATPINGSSVGAPYVYVAWSSAGDRVFMSGSGPGGRRVLLQYRLGALSAVRIPVRVRDFYGMAAR
jgi:WD40 repeat protein